MHHPNQKIYKHKIIFMNLSFYFEDLVSWKVLLVMFLSFYQVILGLTCFSVLFVILQGSPHTIPERLYHLTIGCYRYFMATDSAGQRDLYKVSSEQSSAPHSPSCESCKLAAPPCRHNDIKMSPETTFFIQNCVGPHPDIPFSRLIQTQGGFQ